jgi:hypothetical protein
MSSPSLPASGAAAPQRPVLDAAFGSIWPEEALDGRPRLVAAAVLVGILGAVVLPYRQLGIGTFLVLAGVAATVAWPRRGELTSYQRSAAVLSLLLLTPLFLRDAAWIALLCLLASGAVAAAALVQARSLPGLLASAAAVPLAGIRGLPWLGRSATAPGRVAVAAPVLRTGAVSIVLVLVFGALFASADAVFARWVDAVVPDLTVDTLLLRVFVLCFVGGIALAGAYVALNPPQVDRLALPAAMPVRRPFEWLVPVGAVVAVFAVFVAAQLSVMFGGHAYLRRTTGLTYADYVHEGFGQLTVATILTLAVVALAARRAPREQPRDRLLLRLALGALCALTLVVVASALFRMHVYEEAYGFTQLRLLVSVFEGWLGLVVLMVLAAGVRLRGHWVPRAALLSGATALLLLAALNPDGYVAERNVGRYLETGKADWAYLGGLSADAVPALQALPTGVQACVLERQPNTDDWLEWNLGRSRAGSLVPAAGNCPSR